jgi:two-component system, NtrC family, C4-dicarboxylate transport sensor histidine kinase DctB
VEPIDVKAAISAALSMMEPQLKRSDIRIVTSLPREPLMVMADRIRLEQVLINLIRNALDATRHVASPEVQIMASGGQSVMIAVRDNGEGIADLERLFEPFYTTKAAGDGVGLGLAISSSIVNDFGGRLTARNGREGGAVFEVILPALNAGKQAAE